MLKNGSIAFVEQEPIIFSTTFKETSFLKQFDLENIPKFFPFEDDIN